MATGPEHYREAERLLTDCTNSLGRLVIEDGTAEVLAAATAHALLAQAAATALNRPDGEGMVRDDYREWMHTASVKPPKSTGKPGA